MKVITDPMFDPEHERVRHVSNRHIAPRVLLGALRSLASHPAEFGGNLRRGTQNTWIAIKRTGATGVQNIAISDVPGLANLSVCGHLTHYDSLVLAGLCRLLECANVFEIGTYLGKTTWILAHNNPRARVTTLDLPDADARSDVKLELTDAHLFEQWDRGAAFRGTTEAERITQLYGDTATFDFSPFYEACDLVFIDASHSYSYVKSDTENALRMLTATGTIAWHDYPAYPGVYAYLNELGRRTDRKIVHLVGTGLAVYSRHERFAPVSVRPR
jgi:predicted O-methyltransferase YrrM